MIVDIGLTLAHALDAVAFAEDRLGFRPDDWQARLLRSTAPQVIVNNGRQTGKSTTVAALATHTAIFGDGALVLLISPTLRQSVELGRKVVDCLSRIEPLEELTEDNKTSLTLKRNGSRVVALPGHDPKTLRGYSAPALIVEDESAFVSDETHAAVVPMLAASPNGRLILLSTPNLTIGHFYEIWHGSGTWERYEVPTRNCPRVSVQWLEERRRENPHKFPREYECKFAGGDDCLFPDSLLDSLVAHDFQPFFQ